MPALQRNEPAGTIAKARRAAMTLRASVAPVSTTALAVWHLLQRIVRELEGNEISVSHWGQRPAEVGERTRRDATAKGESEYAIAMFPR